MIWDAQVSERPVHICYKKVKHVAVTYTLHNPVHGLQGGFTVWWFAINNLLMYMQILNEIRTFL